LAENSYGVSDIINMPLTKKDNILIKNLFELKGYNATHLVREFPRKSKKCQQRPQVIAIAMGYWLIDRCPASGRCRSVRIDLVDNWHYTKI